jgi:hypothetical protein
MKKTGEKDVGDLVRESRIIEETASTLVERAKA